jgi:hypothetical protein
VPDQRRFVADLDAVLEELPSRSAQILPLQIDPRDPRYLGFASRPVVLTTSLLQQLPSNPVFRNTRAPAPLAPDRLQPLPSSVRSNMPKGLP